MSSLTATTSCSVTSRGAGSGTTTSSLASTPPPTLANNRSAMWAETLASLKNGAFGDPSQLDTLLLYWGKMELLHYPGAKDTKEQLERRKLRALQQAGQASGGELDAVQGLRD